jgi:hypothetical protein
MADEKKGGPPKNPLQEDQIIARLVSGSTQTPTGLVVFVGLLGRSAKEGHWLLYPTLDMSRTIEIREEDIVHSEQLSAEKSPFGSLGGTRVFVKQDAKVTTTRTVSHTHEARDAAEDEFDLDIRLGGGQVQREQCQGTEFGTTCGAECPSPTGAGQTCLTCVSCRDTCFRTCRGPTCRTCDTCRRTCNTDCGQGTCNTCQTRCGQNTCGQATCRTCQTQCGTCDTCQTQCGQATCETCRTQCDTCPGDTCAACTHVTCFRTCDVC